MSIRISAVFSVFNAMEYFPYSLRSIYDHVEEIVIFDGLIDQFNKDGSIESDNGSSTDGTLEFIKSFPDTGHKIILDTRKWEWEKTKRQAMVSIVKPCDYLMIIDSDEVYKKIELEYTRKILEKNPQVLSVWPRHWRFCGDFNRYYEWWGAVYQRWYPECTLYGLREVLYDGKKVYKFPHSESRHVTEENWSKCMWIPGPGELVCYHYSNVCTKEKAHRKKLISVGLGHNMEDWDKKQFGVGLDQKGYEEIRNTMPFKGEHPEVMKSHPYYTNPPEWVKKK